MRRWIWAMLVVVILGGAGVFGYTRVMARTARNELPETVPVQRATLVATVAASGTVVNTSVARLSFGISGVVQELNVKVGDQVTLGQVLARLDTSSLERAVQQARLRLENDQIALEKALTPFTAEDIANAEAAVRQAEAALESAQRNVVITQNSDVVNILPRQRQDEYNYYLTVHGRLLDDYNAGKASKEDIDRAWSNVLTAQARLVQAREQAADAMAKAQSAVQKAQEDLAKAQANLAKMQAGPDPQDVRLKQNQVELSRLALEAALRDLEQARLVAPFSGVVSNVAIRAGERVAANAVAIELIDPTALTIEASVTETDVARLQVGQEVRLRFDGIPATQQVPLLGRVETISPTGTVQQGVVNYKVTIGLSESAPTRAGLPGGARADAQSTDAERGRPTAQERGQGAQVAQAQQALRSMLRAGMTATAEIVIEQAENVLAVPNRALARGAEGNRIVRVLVNGQVEERLVQVGLSTDQFTEIRAGLSEGELVVVPTGTASQLPTQFRGLGGGGGGGLVPVQPRQPARGATGR